MAVGTTCCRNLQIMAQSYCNYTQLPVMALPVQYAIFTLDPGIVDHPYHIVFINSMRNGQEPALEVSCECRRFTTLGMRMACSCLYLIEGIVAE